MGSQAAGIAFMQKIRVGSTRMRHEAGSAHGHSLHYFAGLEEQAQLLNTSPTSTQPLDTGSAEMMTATLPAVSLPGTRSSALRNQCVAFAWWPFLEARTPSSLQARGSDGLILCACNGSTACSRPAPSPQVVWRKLRANDAYVSASGQSHVWPRIS